MDIKLIALDLDGTALDETSHLAQETIEALNAAVAKGVHVVIDTGRPYCALPEDIFGVPGIEYVITSNGALATKLASDETVHATYHNPEAVDELIDLLTRYDYAVEVMVGKEAYMSKHVLDNLWEYGLTPSRSGYLLRTRKPVPDIYEFLKGHRTEISNIIVDFPNQEERDKLMDILIRKNITSVTNSMPTNVELGGPGTSKAGGLLALGQILGVKPDEMMAIGDSANDIAMLEACGLAVAMGNATPEVLKTADYVTLSNAEHGVAHAIKKFVL